MKNYNIIALKDKEIKFCKGWLACFDGVELKGCLEAGGLEESNAVSDRKDLLEKAYNMGKNI